MKIKLIFLKAQYEHLFLLFATLKNSFLVLSNLNIVIKTINPLTKLLKDSFSFKAMFLFISNAIHLK